MSNKLKTVYKVGLLCLLILLLAAIPQAQAQDDVVSGDPEPVPDVGADAIRASENPSLKNAVDFANIAPITPYDGPPGTPHPDPSASISYDLATGQVDVMPSSEYERSS